MCEHRLKRFIESMHARYFRIFVAPGVVVPHEKFTTFYDTVVLVD